MNFKIDTKDAFYVISPNTTEFTAKLADELIREVTILQNENRKSLVFNLEKVISVDREAIAIFNELYEKTIGEKKSFVLCCLTPLVKASFSEGNLMEKINHTPTESEAWDIVQMEEIERELDFNPE